MSLLKALFILLSVMGILSGITGIASIQMSGTETLVTRHDLWGRIVAIVLAAFFAGVWYGLQRRFITVWRVGWAFMIVLFADFLYSSLSWSLTLTGVERWLVSTGLVVLGVACAVWAVVWWKQKRSYFCA
jgi:hypothetical protein